MILLQIYHEQKSHNNCKMELEESAVINEIKTIFESENESAIHDAIAYIHENGSIKMLPLLFDLLAITKSESTKNDIYECLSDTKEKSSSAGCTAC